MQWLFIVAWYSTICTCHAFVLHLSINRQVVSLANYYYIVRINTINSCLFDVLISFSSSTYLKRGVLGTPLILILEYLYKLLFTFPIMVVAIYIPIEFLFSYVHQWMLVLHLFKREKTGRCKGIGSRLKKSLMDKINKLLGQIYNWL